jgi:hypothetical protein
MGCNKNFKKLEKGEEIYDGWSVLAVLHVTIF